MVQIPMWKTTNYEQTESETSDDDEMDEGGERQPRSMVQLSEDMKEQRALAIQRGDVRDAAQMQSLTGHAYCRAWWNK